MTSELEMKEWLDGWFFSIDLRSGGATISKPVPKAFIPDHKPRIYDPDEEEMRVNGNSHDWDDAQDDLIIERRTAGMVFKEIGKELGLSESTIQKRYLFVCSMRGIKPMPRNAGRRRKYPEELELRVVSLRSDGKTFTEIAELVKLKRSFVYEIFRTYLARIKRYERMERQAA